MISAIGSLVSTALDFNKVSSMRRSEPAALNALLPRLASLVDLSLCPSFNRPLAQATLTGALDIIAVRHDDGTIVCTPFHVRFGKLKVFRTRDKLVRLHCNGQATDLVMRVSHGGANRCSSDVRDLGAKLAASEPALVSDH